MSQTAVPTDVRTVGHREIPAPGRYQIDPSHSSVEFVARFLRLTKVRGRFAGFRGTIDVAADPLASSVEVEIDAASIDSGDEKRDGHLRSPDFLDTDHHATLHFRSTAVAEHGDRWRVTGDLTIRGVTRPVTLDVAFEGAESDPEGTARIGVSATGQIDREEWGLTWNQALETGGVLVGRTVAIELAVSAVAES